MEGAEMNRLIIIGASGHGKWLPISLLEVAA